MKLRILVSSVLMFGLVASASASEKICFGSKNNEDTRGAVMEATITYRNVSFKTVKLSYNGVWNSNGTYPTYGTKTNGRDGKTYLNYKGDYIEVPETIMVDQDLLQAGTQGLIQFRARGEGFFNSVFFCKDPR